MEWSGAGTGRRGEGRAWSEGEEGEEGEEGAAAAASAGAAGESYGFAAGDSEEADARVLQLASEEDEERSRRRRRRRAGAEAEEEAAEASGSDSGSCSGSGSGSDSEAGSAPFAAAGWAEATLAGALRRGRPRRKRARGGGGAAPCWGCRHGLTGGSECPQESLRPLVEFVSSYYGTMDDAVFALEVAKLHASSVQRPQERLGKGGSVWSASSVLEHFRHHTLHPRICDVQRLRSLRAVSGELRKRVIRSYTDEDGERKEEVNKTAVAMLLKVMDRETQLHRASNRQLFAHPLPAVKDD